MHPDGDNEISNVKLGAEWTFAPSFVSAEWEYAIMVDIRHRNTWIESIDSTGAIMVTTKMDEHFATSSDDLWAGGSGEMVFIGAGLNYIFAKVGVVEVEGCQVLREDAVGVDPAGFATTFAYTESHIADVVIPGSS